MKRLIIILSVALAIVATAVAVYRFYIVLQQREQPADALVEDEGTTVTNEGPTTNKLAVFCEEEGEEYNPLIIGHWVSENSGWHKVYTEEYSGNGYYWGKEWDESEDITEADLVDYGNGWFEWKMEGEHLLELASTDMNSARIPVEYLLQVRNHSLTLTTVSDHHQTSFHRHRQGDDSTH